VHIHIPDDDVAAFFAYLGIGVLHAIGSSTVPPKTGIWTVGQPKVWGALINHGDVPQEIIDVFKTGDELSALQKLAPDQLNPTILELIGRLQVELAKIPDPTWMELRIDGDNPPKPT
jgi:hypothetical protein